MSTRLGTVQSRQERQAARLRGAGTAKVQNVGFRIQGGPGIKARTPARRTPARTPGSSRRPQLEDLPQSNTRTSTTRTPMLPPPLPKSTAKSARQGPVAARKTSDPLTDPIVTPSVRQRRGRPSTSAPNQPTPTIELPEVQPEGNDTPPSPVAETRPPPKRKAQTRDTRPTPSKRQRKSLPSPSSTPPPEEESASEVSTPEASSASPPPESNKSRRKPHDLDPGTIELRVHKLAPSAGGTRQLNEIDGFLQVATEVLTRTAERILRQDATQAKILDAFTEEVTIRLIEMTDAWDSHAVLVNAVRRAKKRKDVLRGELLAIRRERAGIAREMEAVRQGHEVGVKEMADLKVQQDFIADMEDLKARLPDTEEEDSVKNGIEAALLEIRPLVAGKSGIAERFAAFNRFLERFDTALTKASR